MAATPHGNEYRHPRTDGQGRGVSEKPDGSTPRRASAHASRLTASRPGMLRPTRARTHSAHEPASGMFDRIKGAVLHVLNHNERLLLVLWYAERMTPAEVARTLDLTVTQALSLHEQILNKLRAVTA